MTYLILFSFILDFKFGGMTYIVRKKFNLGSIGHSQDGSIRPASVISSCFSSVRVACSTRAMGACLHVSWAPILSYLLRYRGHCYPRGQHHFLFLSGRSSPGLFWAFKRYRNSPFTVATIYACRACLQAQTWGCVAQSRTVELAHHTVTALAHSFLGAAYLLFAAP